MPLFLSIWIGCVVFGIGLIFVMRLNRETGWLIVILLLTSFSIWVSLPDNPGIHIDTNNDGLYNIDKEITIRQGLDLAGGLKVLLEADVPEDRTLDQAAMSEVRRIIESRIDSLGALEPTIQLQGERRIIIELPGYENPEAAVELIKETALLEFVALPGGFPAGTPVLTTLAVENNPELDDGSQTIYETVMTGEILATASAQQDNAGNVVVGFTTSREGTDQFGEYTTLHQGEILGIVLDGVVISSPVINEPITGGQGVISGDFTIEEAQQLATQLRYGALPVPLRLDSTSTVGPTLGQISVERSIQAGLIGIGVVLIFMIVYYRIPGISAALALLVFAVFNLTVYKLLPVTMTLPAITGFLISVGTAVDGNILIFERLKEELRAGKRINKAIEAGFIRARTSIVDSNLSTLIICLVLYGFGTSFGAGAVRGFAVTLALGLMINLFTALTVTRVFLHFIMLPLSDKLLSERRWLLGL